MFTYVNMKGDKVVVSTRIPKQTLIQIKSIVKKDNYINEADFVRSAIRSELFKNKIEEIKTELWKTKDSPKAVRKLRDVLEPIPREEYESWVKDKTREMR